MLLYMKENINFFSESIYTQKAQIMSIQTIEEVVYSI